MKQLTHTWNPNYIRRNTVIQIGIVSLAFLMLIRVWPCNLVKTHHVSKQKAVTNYKELSGDPFTNSDKKLQTVTFIGNHIEQIKIYLSCSSYQEGDRVLFRLYNEEFSCIYEQDYACSRIAREHMLVATPDMDVDLEHLYYYEVIVPEEVSAVLEIAYADNSLLSQAENGILYIDGIINESSSLIADFRYSNNLSAVGMILCDLLIILCAVLCYVGIFYILDRLDEYLPEVIRYGRWIATGFGGMFAIVVFILAVIRNIFGGEAADRIVYTIGILVGLGWYMCAIWIPRDPRKPSRLAPDAQISLIWRNYIQVVCLGFLIYALCMYVNADREYYHDTNTRWMLIFLGIAFLMIRPEKELFHIPAYIWTGASVIGACIYCFGFTEPQEQYLARLTAAVVVVWGNVIINALMQYKRQMWKNIDKPFALLWLVFAVFMVINRYGKTWPFTATLPFAVLLLYNLSTAQKSRLLKNFTNGLLFNFGLIVLFSLLHRPYHHWMLYRYNMIFHTVASTGMYLSTVFAAVIGKLFYKWRDYHFNWKKSVNELFILGAVSAFTLFSISRTAMLTMFITFAFVMILRQWVYGFTIQKVGLEVGAIALTILLSFPFTYSTLRIVPAVVNDPIRYELEPQDSSFMIYEGDPVDSDKYMSINRFLNVFLNRFDNGDGEKVQIQEVENSLLAYNGKEKIPILANETEEKYTSEKTGDISNGRYEIFMTYLKRLNFVGHEKMTIEGEDYAHAHNSYIQVAYDFGIIAGVVFLVLCAYTLIQSVLLFKKQGNKYGIFIVPFALIVNFGFMSVTEWAFHPCIPAGFCFLFVQMLLMQEGKTNKG